MEAQTDMQAYLEQGRLALARGEIREGAIAYAHAAQIEPNNALVHLGLAEANLGLRSYGIVQMACRKVQELQPVGGIESTIAQALLALLDRRYDRALQDVDEGIRQDPGNGYAHALRAYLLRMNGQDYDAALVRARAARLSYGGSFENCFPPVEAASLPNNTTPVDSGKAEESKTGGAASLWGNGPRGLQRQMIRPTLGLNQNPRIVTNTLIAVNTVVYVILALLSRNPLDIDENVLLNAGAQVNILIAQGQYWRIFTAMFLHLSILHIGLNMLSLFFVGTAIEVFFGKWRYLAIYLGSGLAGGISTYFFSSPLTIAAGASGAIFGAFGALGVFYIVNRHSLGILGRGAISNWLFWLGLNLIWGFSVPNIGIVDHIGGLIAGMIIAALFLLPKQNWRIS